VRGTGPGRRILQRDVGHRAGFGWCLCRRDAGESAERRPMTTQRAVTCRRVGLPSGRRPQARVVEATRMRMAIANRMAEAKREIRTSTSPQTT
jgi:pyruvate/2-oxoglutarate dehydrogenase complex dihydrolipoamide acyltransferase (E2) component